MEIVKRLEKLTAKEFKSFGIPRYSGMRLRNNQGIVFDKHQLEKIITHFIKLDRFKNKFISVSLDEQIVLLKNNDITRMSKNTGVSKTTMWRFLNDVTDVKLGVLKKLRASGYLKF